MGITLEALDDIELPDEILDLLPDADQGALELFDAIAKTLSKKRTDAMNHRESQGIDSKWEKNEDNYNGIDDNNRAYQKLAVPALGAPAIVQTQPKATTGKSSAFVRLTARYVDSGFAKVSELLIGPGDRAFGFSATPVTEFIDGTQDKSVMTHPDGSPMERFKFQGEHNPPAPIGQANGQPTYPLTTADVVEEQLSMADQKAKKAEQKVADWMIECRHSAEMRKVIFDSSRLGAGVLKGPFPVMKRHYAVMRKKGLAPGDAPIVEVVMKESIRPADKWVNPWNIYPDPTCGDNVRNGSYIFEREYTSERGILDLIGQPGYIRRQILKALEAGPKMITSDRNPSQQTTTPQFEFWHYHGLITRKELEALNPKAVKGIPRDREYVDVMITMIGDIVVRGTLNPLMQSGSLPYLSIPWQPKPGSWVGTGVADQVQVAQEITNASTRALLNNAAISGGPQIVITRGLVEPADGVHEITPNKLWYFKDDGSMDDVRKAFNSFTISNVGDQLMKIVEYGMRLAEESSSIPLVTQGQSGKTTPDTYGATQLQDNNANQLLRSIAATFDDYITEPLVMTYYEWYLLDPTIPAEDKMEFVINAHGSAAIVEQAIQDRSLVELLPVFLNPQFGFNPKKVGKLIAKSRRLNPADLQYTKEEQDKIDSTPPPPAPAVQVAQIKAEIEKMKMQIEANVDAAANASAERIAEMETTAEREIAQLREQTAQLKIKMDTDRDTVYVQTQLKNAQTIYQGKLEELRLKRELAISQFAMDHQLSIDQAKTKLADSAMKLKMQKELAHLDAQVQLKTKAAKDVERSTMKPPVQVPGRAKDAFSQI